MKLIMTVFLLCGLSAFGECVDDPDKFMQKVAPGSEISVHKFMEHKIFVPKDSCGAKGCELYVFSPRSTKCHQLSLNIKGHLFPETLKRGFIGVQENGKLKAYRYDLIQGAFK